VNRLPEREGERLKAGLGRETYEDDCVCATVEGGVRISINCEAHKKEKPGVCAHANRLQGAEEEAQEEEQEEARVRSQQKCGEHLTEKCKQ
jgi:hypothetical protein